MIDNLSVRTATACCMQFCRPEVAVILDLVRDRQEYPISLRLQIEKRVGVGCERDGLPLNAEIYRVLLHE